MSDFWARCGYHLLARTGDGHLVVTDEYLRSYFERPELALVGESCARERALHVRLLESPRAAVSGEELEALADPDARENYSVMLRFRDQLVGAHTLEAFYFDLFRRDVAIPPPFIHHTVEVILRGILEGRADGSYPVTWTPTTGLTFPANDPLHPVASPLVTTTYTLSAGAGGCANADQVTVTVRPPIRIPNAFTPNNDGRDDTWQIEFIEQFPDNTVSVFNRWGNRVFSANNYSRANEWRGDINGQPAPVGTYYYVVVTKGPLGKSYSGSITILY